MTKQIASLLHLRKSQALVNVSVVSLVLLLATNTHAGFSRLSAVPLTDVFSYGQCRADQQTQLTLDKRPADTAGRHNEYSLGVACNIFSQGIVTIDGGVDLLQAYFHHSDNVVEMAQGYLQLSLYRLKSDDWSIYGGMHGIGVGTNASYNVAYAMAAHNSGSWQAGLGIYSGNKKLLKDNNGRADAQGSMVYIQKSWSRSRASLEYLTGKNRFGFLWVGMQWDYSPTVQFTTSYGLANDRQFGRDWIMVRSALAF
jgi:hypothetical protein